MKNEIFRSNRIYKLIPLLLVISSLNIFGFQQAIQSATKLDSDGGYKHIKLGTPKIQTPGLILIDKYPNGLEEYYRKGGDQGIFADYYYMNDTLCRLSISIKQEEVEQLVVNFSDRYGKPLFDKKLIAWHWVGKNLTLSLVDTKEYGAKLFYNDLRYSPIKSLPQLV